jgi:hypothetical protein
MDDVSVIMHKILELLDNPKAHMCHNGMIEIPKPHAHFRGDVVGGILRMGVGQKWVALHVGDGLPVVRRFYLSDPDFFDKIVEAMGSYKEEI